MTLEYVYYILWPANKVRIRVYYLYNQVDTWEYRWSYTPGTIHKKHCSFRYYSLNIQFIVAFLWTFLWSLIGHRGPLRKIIMLTIEPRMMNISWICTPTSLKHMPFWFPFLHSHLTTHHSNIVVWSWEGGESYTKHLFSVPLNWCVMLIRVIVHDLSWNNMSLMQYYLSLVARVIYKTICVDWQSIVWAILNQMGSVHSVEESSTLWKNYCFHNQSTKEIYKLYRIIIHYVTYFKSITMLCGTNHISQNIPPYSNWLWTNILWNLVSPIEHRYGSEQCYVEWDKLRTSFCTGRIGSLPIRKKSMINGLLSELVPRVLFVNLCRPHS